MNGDVRKDPIEWVIYWVDGDDPFMFIVVVLLLAIVIAIGLSAFLWKSWRFNAANIATASLSGAFILYFVSIVTAERSRIPPGAYRMPLLQSLCILLFVDPVFGVCVGFLIGATLNIRRADSRGITMLLLFGCAFLLTGFWHACILALDF